MSRRKRVVHYVHVSDYGVVYKVTREVFNAALRSFVLENSDISADVRENGEQIGETIELATMDKDKAVRLLLEGY